MMQEFFVKSLPDYHNPIFNNPSQLLCFIDILFYDKCYKIIFSLQRIRQGIVELRLPATNRASSDAKAWKYRTLYRAWRYPASLEVKKYLFGLPVIHAVTQALVAAEHSEATDAGLKIPFHW